MVAAGPLQKNKNLSRRDSSVAVGLQAVIFSPSPLMGEGWGGGEGECEKAELFRRADRPGFEPAFPGGRTPLLAALFRSLAVS